MEQFDYRFDSDASTSIFLLYFVFLDQALPLSVKQLICPNSTQLEQA